MGVIHTEHSSPINLYAELSRVATDAVADIKDFTQSAQDSEMQEILKKAKETKGNDESGITSWVVTQHPKWLEKPVKVEYRKSETDDEQMDGDKTLSKASGDDPTTIVDQFRKDHPDVDVVLDQELRKIKVRLSPHYRTISC